MTLLLTLTLLALFLGAFALGRQRALACTGPSGSTLHSRPHYHGHYVAIWCAAPALAVLLLASAIEPVVVEEMLAASAPKAVQSAGDPALSEWVRDVQRLAVGDPTGREPDRETQVAAEHIISWGRNAAWTRWAAVFVAGVAGLLVASRRIEASLRARPFVESTVRKILMASAAAAILVTIGIVLSLIFESVRFFSLVPWSEFLFGTQWSPQTALRADQVGSSGAFGAVPVFAGTLLITLIAMSVSVPVGLFSAIYLSEYAGVTVRAVVKPLLEILAGVPTVVYGFFAALTVAPWMRRLGGDIGIGISSESAMAAGLVMGIMIIPFVSSLSDDVINAVPAALREGSLGLGATRSETIRRVVLPAALPGIVGSVLLAISRAIGETMIVVMAAGLAANLTANPFEAVTTVTVQIVTLLVGDQEFDSAKTLAAFALGLTLFAVTLVLNVIALRVVRRYREQYD